MEGANYTSARWWSLFIDMKENNFKYLLSGV